ncbi:MAG: four helix bundle protein [Patescibacteria group bacterium]
MKITKVEDLNVWQEARLFCNDIYDLIKNFPADEKYNIVRHLRENARGIPANIAEGFYRYHYQDSIRFYLIARGCIGEMKSDLYISLDRGYITKEKFEDLNNKIEKILIMLNGMIKSTKNQIKNTNN